MTNTNVFLKTMIHCLVFRRFVVMNVSNHPVKNFPKFLPPLRGRGIFIVLVDILVSVILNRAKRREESLLYFR
jgi:hypothetical protein